MLRKMWKVVTIFTIKTFLREKKVKIKDISINKS